MSYFCCSHVIIPFVSRPSIDVDQINDTLVESKLSLGPVSRKDNGTYRCIAYGPQGEVSKAVPLFVLGEFCIALTPCGKESPIS